MVIKKQMRDIEADKTKGNQFTENSLPFVLMVL